MPNRRQRRNRPRRRARMSTALTSMEGYRNQVITQSFVEQPFVITQASSGTGGISSSGGGSGASITSVGFVQIDPFTIGGRFAQVAGMFTQYRVNSLEVDFIPDSTSAGYLENVAGGTTAPVLIHRDFAWDLIQDPAVVGAMTSTQILLSGGTYSSTSRRCRLRVGRQPWLYTSTVSSFGVATTIDFRQASPLILRFAYAFASTTGTQRYGVVLLRANVSFRGPLVLTTVIGLAPEESK